MLTLKEEQRNQSIDGGLQQDSIQMVGCSGSAVTSKRMMMENARNRQKANSINTSKANMAVKREIIKVEMTQENF